MIFCSESACLLSRAGDRDGGHTCLKARTAQFLSFSCESLGPSFWAFPLWLFFILFVSVSLPLFISSLQPALPCRAKPQVPRHGKATPPCAPQPTAAEIGSPGLPAPGAAPAAALPEPEAVQPPPGGTSSVPPTARGGPSLLILSSRRRAAAHTGAWCLVSGVGAGSSHGERRAGDGPL